MLKRVLLATAALVAAVVVYGWRSLPPLTLELSAPADLADLSVAGVIHVHSNRSDGRSSPIEIADAAGRAGLKFVVVTDHGDGTRAPDPPLYRNGVLVLDGVEISTDQGHYLAIGMRPAPYRLGGDARDVAEEVARLGGFGVIAHPDSPKRELQWSAWNVPFDGMEILNLDTSWRLHAMNGSWPKLKLFDALTTYPVRPAETIADLARPSPEIVRRWAGFAQGRRVVAIAGSDAHARLALTSVDPQDDGFSLPFPGYESSFRALSVHVTPDRHFTGDAIVDAEALVGGLRAGRLFLAVTGIAAPPALEFTATSGTQTVLQGGELKADGPIMLRVRSNAPADFVTQIWRDLELMGEWRQEGPLEIAAPEGPGVYRVEIRAADRADEPAWLYSNPIYVRDANAQPVLEPPAAPSETRSLFDGKDVRAWRVEAGSGTGEVTAAGGELQLQFPVRSDPEPVAVLTTQPDGVAPFEGVRFSARADRPMRVSVQLRTNQPGAAEQRWRRSVFVDQTPRSFRIPFADLLPIGPTLTLSPPPDKVPYVLFVVDVFDGQAPGKTVSLWMSNIALER